MSWVWLLWGLGGAVAAPDAVEQRLDDARGAFLEGRIDEALSAWQVLEADPALSETQRAAVLNNTCVGWMRQGRPERALEACERALILRRSLGDARGASRTLSNIGWASRTLGRVEDAWAAYAEALQLAREEGFTESEVVILDNLGTLALRTGDLGGALDLYDQAEAVAVAHEGAAWARRQRAVAVLNQGTVLEKLGQAAEAVERYHRLDPALVPDDLRATFAMNLGALYRNLEMPGDAEARFAEAASLFASRGDAAGHATALVNVGLLQLDNLHRPADALRTLRRALVVAGDDNETARVAAPHLGRALTRLSRLEEATRVHEEGLRDAVEAGDPEGRWSHLYGLGGVDEARGDWEAAWRHHARAMAVVDQAGERLDQLGQTDAFLKGQRAIFDAAARVALRLDDPRRALAVVLQAKERELANRLGRGAEVASVESVIEAVGSDTLLEYYLGQDEGIAVVVHAGRLSLHRLGDTREVTAAARALTRALALGRVPEPEVLGRASALLPTGVTLDGRVQVAPDGLLRLVPFELLGDPPLLDRATVSVLTSGSARVSSGLDRGRSLRVLGISADAGDGPDALAHAEEEVRRAAASLGDPSRVLAGASATPTAVAGALAIGADVVHIAAHTELGRGATSSSAIRLVPDDAHPDGLLDARTLAGMDLDVGLTVLASCRSADGPRDQALGTVAGGFLAAGSGAVVATLWDVDDATTRQVMDQLYHELGLGHPAAEALRRVKLRLRSTSGWQDPHLWSGFVLYGHSITVAPPWWRAPLAWAVVLGGLLVGGWWKGRGGASTRKTTESTPSPPSPPPARPRGRARG